MLNQNKRPVLFRAILALVVIGVFAYSIFPITERNFTEVLKETLKYNTTDSKLQLALDEAEKIYTDTTSIERISEAEATMKACDLYGVNLADHIDSSAKLRTTKDFISLVKNQCASAVRLGIDLKGGVEYLIELADLTDEEGGTQAMRDIPMSEKTDKARETIRRRLENNGIFESEISIQQGKFVCIRAPLRSQEEKMALKKMITAAAKLRFHLVAPYEMNQEEVAKYQQALAENNPRGYRPPNGYQIMRCTQRVDKQGIPMVDYYLVQTKAEMNGNDIRKASVTTDQNGKLEISLSFGDRGTRDFSRVTKDYTHRMLAIVLDGVLYSAPTLNEHIMAGNARISGSFTYDEAQGIANALGSGNLPFKMVVSGEYDVDQTLGEENSHAGMIAGLISLVLVMIFMGFYYLKSGWIANLALVANIVLVLGALSAFQQTLTLPGIAGVILTIGMAVDANVLINERIREEIQAGKSLLHAIENGYARAFLTIFDANITTLIVGIILMWFATGAVKGFAIVLTIGIITSMFTALFMTRIIFDILSRFDRPKSLPMFDFFGLGTKIKINFLGMRKLAFILSLVLLLISVGAFIFRGPDALSIDFRGGTQLTYFYQGDKLPEAKLLDALKAVNIEQVKINYKGTINQNILEIIVGKNQPKMTTKVDRYSPMVVQAINTVNPQFLIDPNSNSEEKSIDGLVGATFIQTALLSILLAAVGIMIYVALRFEFAFALGASIALLHDVVIAAGIFVLLGGELSLTVVAALLTLYGYSINDTIVIYDRIREQHKLFPERSFYQTINASVNQTLPRTILTSLTVLITVATLLIGGGSALFDFGLVMFFGLVIGTYSSVFIASPIVYWWNKHFGIKYDEPSEVELAPEVETKSV